MGGLMDDISQRQSKNIKAAAPSTLSGPARKKLRGSSDRMTRESDITINGSKLTIGQSMAVRVAIADFFSLMHQPDVLGDDAHGRAMTSGYRDRLGEVIGLFF
jgi:hypothetical protein